MVTKTDYKECGESKTVYDKQWFNADTSDEAFWKGFGSFIQFVSDGGINSVSVKNTKCGKKGIVKYEDDGDLTNAVTEMMIVTGVSS